MIYYMILAVSYIACLMPGRLADAVGRSIALVLWPFLPKKRKELAVKQIIDCLGVTETEAKHIAKESTLRFGSMLLEVLRFPYINRHMEDFVTIEGKEHMAAGLAAGRGGIIATGHTGNWELLGGALSHAGFPIVGVAQRQKEAAADKFINRYRTMIGMHITYKDDVREMFQMMKQGWAIGLLADQDANRKDGIVLNFFGHATNCVTGPASLARSQNVPMVPIFITKQKDGRHRVICHPPIEVAHTKDKKKDIADALQQYQNILEAHIRAYPTEWFWLHDRWKSMRNRS
ncbi:lysophospholipid acyltransferase family protein [Selenomonas sp. TAMA-11512]|uniref:lysophospholipid acyltransferase family protein n=1 Tax=Selenomonas sp. TAMA-11512 TaxID=3095337 RepID=UPI0030CFB64B